MSTLVVKKLPEPLHQRLCEHVRRNRRSVTEEAIVILQHGLATVPPRREVRLAAPIDLEGGPVSTEWIEAAIAARHLN